MTIGPRQASELLARHGLAPSRAFGQNFVVDPNTVRRIVRLAGVGPGDHVVEVGPGLGALTLELADAGASVVAIEVDRGLIGVLTEVLGDRAVTVVHADAMAAPWDELLDPALAWSMVANLPYNVATPLVCDVLDGVPQVQRLTVMVQHEVAERLSARVGDGGYGAVSVKVAYWATAAIVAKVPPTVFLPRPKVDSAVVQITRRPAPLVDPAVVAPAELFALVRHGFAKRRKMLRGALAGVVSVAQLEAAGVRPEARAEELTVQDWGRIAAVVAGSGS